MRGDDGRGEKNASYHEIIFCSSHGIMGTGIPEGGVAEKMSPPTTVEDEADMQLPCYQTRESPSSGKCSIFCYRFTYISKMCSMHTKHFYWGGIAVIVMAGASHKF